MRARIAAAVLLVSLASVASAEVRYDRKLEAAVLAKVASSIGDIRPAFGLRDKVAYVHGAAEPMAAIAVPEVAVPDIRRELRKPPVRESRSIEAF